MRHDPPSPDRPFLSVNFVASVDGRTTVSGESRRLSGAADRELFYALRERVDAVLVGPNTLAAERYKRMLPQHERRARRQSAGRDPEPLMVTVTRSGRLPFEIPIFQEPEARILVFASDPPVAAGLAATVEYAPLTTLPDAMRALHNSHGIRTLLCEGGPGLFTALLVDRLVDELLLTVAPTLIGRDGEAALVSGGALPAPIQAAPLSVLERDGTLFLRYRIGG